MNELVRIAELARDIIDSDQMSWEEKYDRIFSMEVSRYVSDVLGVYLDYYDPDTSYEEDVRAYVTALEERVGIYHSTDCRGSHCSRCGSCDGGFCVCYAR